MSATPGGSVPANPIAISTSVARRYLLGRQGLWPGRRWLAMPGAAAAICALESLQMDAVAVVARSHDLALFGRVGGYRPADLDQLLYTDRDFFDYGGHLDIYPTLELPYWRQHMRRRQASPREGAYRATNRVLLDRVLATVAEQGPLLASDLAWATPAFAEWRSASDVGQALYHLWITGQLMTHSRRNFRRTFDLAERIAGPELLKPASPASTRRFFAAKSLRRLGLSAVTAWRGHLFYLLHQAPDKPTWMSWLEEMVAAGDAAWVRIEGVRRPYLVPGADVPLLDSLARAVVPPAWSSTVSSTAEEAVLLSPLDNLLHPDRLRNLEIFDFEFLWEIYKPAEKRRWGAYTMPVLHGDRLVARVEPRLDRQRASFEVIQIWFEDPAGATDSDLLSALTLGLVSLAKFHQASYLDCSVVAPLRLRQSLRRIARQAGFAVR